MPVVEVDGELVGLIEVLRKNYTVGSLSNLTFSRKIIDQQLNLYSHFDFVLLSCDLHLKKPDPKFFVMAIDQAQAMPAEIVYIDDNKKYTQIARDLGTNAIPYTYGNSLQLKTELKTLGIEHLSI